MYLIVNGNVSFGVFVKVSFDDGILLKNHLNSSQRSKVTKRILKLILPLLIILALLIISSVILQSTQKIRRLIPSVSLFSIFILCYILNYMNYVKISAYIYTLSVLVILTLSMVFNGGLYALSFLGFPLILIGSALFFRMYIAWGLFSVTAVLTGLIFFLQARDLLPETPMPDLGLFFAVNLIIFAMEIVIVSSSVKIMNESIVVQYNQESQLKDNEELTKTILDTVGDAIIAIDMNGCILNANRMANILSGSDLIINKGDDIDKIFKLLNKDDSSYSIANNLGMMISRVPLNLVRKDRYIPLMLSGDLLYDRDGNERGMVLTFRDVSKENELQNQLLQSQKMEAIGRLASGVAHDFNNMLGGIFIAADNLEQNVTGNNLEMVSLIQNASERAANLTRQLLAFSRKGKMVSTSVSIHAIINETVAMLKQVLDKSITIKVRLEANDYFVVGDDSQIMNGIMNMAINASHAMEDGGFLTFSTENIFLDKKKCEDSIFEIYPGDYVRLDIADTGVGMSPDTCKRIFEPFFTTKSHGNGTGLGLAAVQGMVESHKGEIEVDSIEGKGTTFHIYLPVSASVKDSTYDELEMSMAGNGETILVVDDEEIVRVAVDVLLRNLNYKCLNTSCGELAISILEQQKVDLVILDMVMPGLNGRKTFEIIHKKYPDLPVLLSSGFTKSEEISQMTKDGLGGFIRKPYSKVELSKILKDILGKKNNSN